MFADIDRPASSPPAPGTGNEPNAAASRNAAEFTDGFTAGAVRKTTLPVTGMTCANCATTAERILRKKVPGVGEASVNLAAETVTIHYDENAASLETLAAAVERAGYGLVLPSPGADLDRAALSARLREVEAERRAFMLGIVLSLPLRC